MYVCMYVINSKFKHNIRNDINKPAGHPIFATNNFIFAYNATIYVCMFKCMYVGLTVSMCLQIRQESCDMSFLVSRS